MRRGEGYNNFSISLPSLDQGDEEVEGEDEKQEGRAERGGEAEEGRAKPQLVKRKRRSATSRVTQVPERASQQR